MTESKFLLEYAVVAMLAQARNRPEHKTTEHLNFKSVLDIMFLLIDGNVLESNDLQGIDLFWETVNAMTTKVRDCILSGTYTEICHES